MKNICIIVFFFIAFFSSLSHGTGAFRADKLLVRWSREVAGLVNGYFSPPYQDETDINNPFYALICPDGTKVFRPNHSLAHGMRQAYLAVDIALMLKGAKGNRFSNTDGQKLVAWLNKKIATDKNFLRKIEMASAFQRSGRQSEISSGQNEKKFRKYLQADQNNFMTKARAYIGPDLLFKDEQEASIFKQAIVKSSVRKPDDIHYLSKIFFTAHLFDLRRLPHFERARIQQKISKHLFFTTTPNQYEQGILQKIWHRAGEYLDATGDRDMDNPNKWDWDRKKFCAQARDAKLLVHALHLARVKPEQQMLDAIVGHAQVMREVKESSPTKKRAPNELREQVAKAPFTASEAYLYLLLGKKFRVIPRTASEKCARKITRKNIEMFLSLPTKLGSPRVAQPDQHYIDMLTDAMMEERAHRDKIVFYHTTEPETGFLYDVYTELRNQLQITGGNDIRALRAIDREFIHFDEEVRTKNHANAARRHANVRDFMDKFSRVADSFNLIRTMALSTNFALFGSDQQPGCDTYNMFFTVKDRIVSIQPLQNDRFFSYIEQYTGISMDYATYEKILKHFILTDANNQPHRNGRLIQIFVDPAIVADVAYPSVLFGAPILKNGSTPNVDEPILLLRESPNEFMKYLQGTSAAPIDNIAPEFLRLTQLKLRDLQTRLFMRPDVMFDQRQVLIKSYFRFNLSHRRAPYFNEIARLVKADLVTWLKAGAPKDQDAFSPETEKLTTLMQQVYRAKNINAPSAKPLSLPEQFVKLLMSGRGAQAAVVLENNYDALKDEFFVIPKDQAGNGGATVRLHRLYQFTDFRPLMKIAFQKGVFPGGDDAYSVITTARTPWFVNGFISLLYLLRNPQESCRLLNKYFMSAEDGKRLIVVGAIDGINADENLIVQSMPLIKALPYEASDLVLRALFTIPHADRDQIVKDVISVIDEISDDNYNFQKSRMIHHIIATVFSLRNLGKHRQNFMWAIAKKISPNWEKRLYLLKGLKTVDDENMLRTMWQNLHDPSKKDYEDLLEMELLKAASK